MFLYENKKNIKGCIINEVSRYITNYGLINKNTTVVIAVSGGVDSVVLLHLFVKYIQNVWNLKIIVAHLNHKLRAHDSEIDEEFVFLLSKSFNLDFELDMLPKDLIQTAMTRSIENEARIYRYKFLESIRKKYSADKILTAHTLSDQLETIIMRLVRGTSTKGLRGILPQNGHIVRPLLSITKEQIQQYAFDNHINWREDSSNQSYIYTRNKIRLDVIPVLKNINKNVEELSGQLSELVSTEENFWDSYISEICKDKIKTKKSHNERISYVSMKKEHLSNTHTAVIFRIFAYLYQMLYQKNETTMLEFKHLHSCFELYKKLNPSVKSLSLPGKIDFISTAGEVIFLSKQSLSTVFGKDSYLNDSFFSLLKENEENHIQEIGHITCRRYRKEHFIGIDFNNKNKAWFSADDLHENMFIRFQHLNDMFIPFGKNKKESLNNFLKRQKITKILRLKTPLICYKNDLLWIVGVRQSNLYKILPETKYIFELEFFESKN